MRTWLTNLWDDLRSGFWFLPAVIIVAAVLLALGMLVVDERLEDSAPLPDWLTSSAPAARTILSALAGALLTGTSVVFSITMLVLAQTASQYGSRLLRTIADGNGAQVTFGLFLGTSVYCLLVLRTVRQDSYGLFVPHLSVAVGVLGGLLSLFALIYFLNETASAIQARTVVHSVHADLEDAIDRLFPNQIGEGADEGDAAENVEAPPDAVPLTDVGLGYLQAIDAEGILAAATRWDVVVHLLVTPGAFVTPSTHVASLVPEDQVDDATRAQLRRCFLLGDRRTPRQDVVCAVDELVEVAVRALSPGINDPFTAMTCVDYLGAALAKLAAREVPARRRVDDDGTVRVVVRSALFADVLVAAVEPLTQHGTGTPSVLLRLSETLARVAESVVRDDDAESMQFHAERVRALTRRRLDDDWMVERIESALEGIATALESSTKPTVDDEGAGS